MPSKYRKHRYYRRVADGARVRLLNRADAHSNRWWAWIGPPNGPGFKAILVEKELRPARGAKAKATVNRKAGQ